uniref:TPR_REGION domain-containing protein n=1 Tax=Panagrellus redivivus TaxID=6233 RepID=A0A7E4URS6_PANRE
MSSNHASDEDRRHRRQHSEQGDRSRRKRRRPDDDSDDDVIVLDDDDRSHVYNHHRRRRHSEHHRHRYDERDHRERRYSDRRRRHSRSSSTGSSSGGDSSKVARMRARLDEFDMLYRRDPPDFDSTEMMARNTLPCFDRERDFEGHDLLKHFFTDVKPGDRLVCKVLRITTEEIELKPECTLTRYRRCLYRIPFPVTSVTAIAEMDLLACSRGDLVSATVAQIDHDKYKIILAVDNYGVPLKTEELPAYYRKLPPPENLEEIPDLPAYLGLAPLACLYSALPELYDQDFDNPRKGPEALRYKLLSGTATDAVTKAAALVKEQKLDEGIAVFTEALTTLPDFVPALIGRGAAYANARKLDEAEADLRRAIDLDSDDATAPKFLATLLVVRGQEAETSGNLEKALSFYNEALLHSDENSTRILRTEVLNRVEDNARRAKEASKREEKRRTEAASKKVQIENSKKLAEMEQFIANLKKK